MVAMGSLPDESTKAFDRTEPLSESEVDELAIALRKLAEEGIALPKHLKRHDFKGEIRTTRMNGYTLDAVPKALDRLGAARESVVVGLIRRFEEAVRAHHNQVYNRPRGTPLEMAIMQRCFDVAFLLCAAQPKTETEAIQVADFLRSEFDDVRAHAAEMLEGAHYFPVVVERLFENITTHGVRQWPHRQSRALASFVEVREVRERLMSCFHSHDESLRYAAVLAFSYVGENTEPEAEAKMFAIAANDEDKLQGAALSGLRKIAPQSGRLRELALRLMQSDKFWVRGNAIYCLEAFCDRESIGALLASLLDEGGHDFDNAGAAAKLLEQMPLDASQVLASLMDKLRTLLEREDHRYAKQEGLGTEIQKLATVCKDAAEEGEEWTDGLGVVFYASPDTLRAVARVLSKLGAAATPAIPLIESCLARPYVSGASDREDWREILEAIRRP